MRNGPMRTHLSRLGLKATLIISTIFLSEQACALDLNGDKNLITETIASRDRLRNYDSRKKYGAESISERSRKHLQPDGGRIGNYFVFPSLESTMTFDDNIFGTAQDTVSDFRVELNPEVQFQSHLPRHILNVALGANLVRYVENTDQNYANYSVAIDGGLHINHANTLGLSVSSQLSHERPGEVSSSLNVGEPVPVFTHKATVGLTHDVGRLYGTVSATAERFDYQDVKARDGTTLDQSIRDMDFLSTQLRAGYRFSPGFDLVGKIRFMRQLHGGVGANDLDANGYEALAGLAFETSPLLHWKILGGYGLRDYDQPGLESIGTSLFEASFEWLPTQKITILGALGREFQDTIGLDQGGRVETSVSLRADLELLNNLVLSLGGEIEDADFNGITRNDRTFRVNAGLQYYLNKNLLLSFKYEHQTRDSNIDAFDMDRNTFMVGAKLRY